MGSNDHIKEKEDPISVQEFRMHILYIQRKAIPTWEARDNCEEWVDIPFIAKNKN